MTLLTAPEVARILRVRTSRVYELAREGLLPATRMGRQLRIDEALLRRWIKSGGEALPGGWRREVPSSSDQSLGLNP